MRPIRTAIFTIVIVAAVAGCAAVAAAPPCIQGAAQTRQWPARRATPCVATPVAPTVVPSIAPVASVAAVAASRDPESRRSVRQPLRVEGHRAGDPQGRQDDVQHLELRDRPA